MALDVKSVKYMPTPNSRICFSTEAPLLAAGSVPSTGNTTLRILRSSLGLPREDFLCKPVAEFSKPPAAFCRICWSQPLGTGGSSCPAGLIAGGLESGEVAVWNPAKELSRMAALHPDEDNFLQNIQQGNWIGKLDLDYDYCTPEKRRKSPASPPLLGDKTGNMASAEAAVLDLKGPVARFSKHLGSVRGLGFSSHFPNLLGSGAENGRIMIWDLADPSAETVPTWQTESIYGDSISCISWSPLLPKVVGSTSLQSVTVWDIRSKSAPVASVGLCPRKTSCLLFHPMDKYSVVVSFEDYLDTASVEVRDLRQMTEPVAELCQDSKGVIAISLSPHDHDTLLISTKNDKLMLLDLPTQKVVWNGESHSGRCYDVEWSGSNRGIFAAALHNVLELFKVNDRARPGH